MKHVIRYTFLKILAAITFVIEAGCGRITVSDGIDATLEEAGSNRLELVKALKYYKGEKEDSLHAMAMCFQVENMAKKGTLAGPMIDEIYTFLDSVYKINQKEYDIPTIYAHFLTGARNLNCPPETQRDASSLTARYLIENVDAAMKLWHNKSWNTHLTFDDFCEYVLPYRVDSEEVESWRATYSARFASLVPDTATALQAALAINDSLRRLPAHIALSGILPVTMRSSTLYNMKFGVCGDYAVLAVLALRAVGVPATINFIPQWGDKSGSHTFNGVLDNDGRWYDFSGAEDNPGDHLHRFPQVIPKIYRLGFGINKQALATICGSEEIPYLFRNPTLVDVTSDFIPSDISEADIQVKGGRRNRFAYLCVFTPQGWNPVAWAEIENGKALFTNVGKNIVYQPALYSDGKTKPFGQAFMLCSNGIIRKFEVGNEKSDITLYRKHPVPKSLKEYPQYIVGGRFEGADNPHFRNPVRLHEIVDTPDFCFTTVKIPPTRPLRYLRYVSSDSTYGNMSEVEFLDLHGKSLHGKTIGHYKPSIYYPNNGADMLFDGDPLSFFHTSDLGAWGGMELSVPSVVSGIRFLIRNDDNGIRRGHDYELFYADNGRWLSLGRVTAENDDEILFADVPVKALLWLHDHTGGREERIFEINDKNKMIWH